MLLLLVDTSYENIIVVSILYLNLMPNVELEVNVTSLPTYYDFIRVVFFVSLVKKYLPH